MTDAAPHQGHDPPPRSFSDRVDRRRTARLAHLDAGGHPGGPPAPGDTTESIGGIGGLAFAGIATFGVTSLIALLLLAIVPTIVFGWASTVIESSSMRPTVERGDIVVLRPIEDRLADVGDVVRFPADDGGSSIVHRIVDVDIDAGAYATKGDANRNDDQALVPFGNVDGLGTLLVPLIGHPALWFQEDRFVLLTLVVAAVAWVVWAGLGHGYRPEDDDTIGSKSDGAGDPANILSGPSLGGWRLPQQRAEPLFVVEVSNRCGRGQPARP